jgi:hypothetical protein
MKEDIVNAVREYARAHSAWLSHAERERAAHQCEILARQAGLSFPPTGLDAAGLSIWKSTMDSLESVRLVLAEVPGIEVALIAEMASDERRLAEAYGEAHVALLLRILLEGTKR